MILALLQTDVACHSVVVKQAPDWTKQQYVLGVHACVCICMSARVHAYMCTLEGEKERRKKTGKGERKRLEVGAFQGVDQFGEKFRARSR